MTVESSGSRGQIYDTRMERYAKAAWQGRRAAILAFRLRWDAMRL